MAFQAVKNNAEEKKRIEDFLRNCAILKTRKILFNWKAMIEEE